MSRQRMNIDGSEGEGGGQVVRSSLALSLLTGTPIRIENIRAKRKKPGLSNQHLTAVKAAVQISGSSCQGAEVGSQQLEFHPGTVAAGHYEFPIHTAGSSTLVLQTVLPALMVADGPSSIAVTGGTHNPLAPTFDFLSLAYAPLVNRLGPQIDLQLKRYGFYPAGGGAIHCNVAPGEALQGLDIIERGKTTRRFGQAIVANLPLRIADREVDLLARKSRWPRGVFAAREVESNGPGNVVTVGMQSEHVTEVFIGFGSRGVPAERVANNVWREAKSYEKSDVPVSKYLADQIILPMAMAAHFNQRKSSFRTVGLTQHTKTHIELLQRFLAVEIDVKEESKDNLTVIVGEKR